MQDLVTNIPSTHPIVSVGEFEGPIEVLLNVIQNRKLPINDVSLAAVTDEYISYINSSRNDDYSYITHFLYIASTLLLIKSRSLLPAVDISDNEEQGIDDLQRRIKLFQLFRDYSYDIKPLFAQPSSFTRPLVMRRKIVFSPGPTVITPGMMSEIIQGLEMHVQESSQDTLPEVQIRTASIHINDMVEDLKMRLHTAIHVSFRDFSRTLLPDATKQEQKVYAIVGFLAMLEMVRNSIISARQDSNFDDIVMNTI